MRIQRKLEYPSWKIPYFIIKSLLISIKLIRTGILFLLIENKYFSKQIELILKILNNIFGNKNQNEIGEKLSKILINLGPGYIKFGQALSTSPDILGKITCDELKKLQDNLKPFPNSISKKIINDENEDFLRISLAYFDGVTYNINEKFNSVGASIPVYLNHDNSNAILGSGNLNSGEGNTVLGLAENSTQTISGDDNTIIGSKRQSDNSQDNYILENILPSNNFIETMANIENDYNPQVENINNDNINDSSSESDENYESTE